MENIEKEQSAETTDLTSGTSEIADTSNDVEFEDSNQSEESSEKVTKENLDTNKNSNKKTNSDYARERRQKEHELALKKARNEAIIEALNGINPYTQTALEDDEDIQEYLTMKEIEKKGLDPVYDYSKHIKSKAKEEIKKSQEIQNESEWINKDREDFIAKHPDINLNEIIEDELFRTFAIGKVGKMSMDKIYTDYQSFVAKSEERARDRAAQVLANNAASPGKLASQNSNLGKSINDMSKSEFDKLLNRVKRGEKIKL